MSVILPCYGMGRYLGEALTSVAAQTHPHFEVIVIDDCGPEDGTREVVEEFVKAEPGKRIVFHRREKNGGAALARNAGVALAQGTIIAFLDPDDKWQPSHLACCLGLLQTADICSTRARCMSATGELMGPFFGERMDAVIAAFPVSLARENFILPSGTAMHRSAWEKVGEFGDNLRPAEDWDYYLRCVVARLRFAFTREETVLYRRHGEGATSNFLKMAQTCVRVLRKNFPDMDTAMQAETKQTLQYFLNRVIYMKVSFRDWSFVENLLSVLKLNPLSPKPWKAIAEGLRNNWHKLAASSS